MSNKAIETCQLRLHSQLKPSVTRTGVLLSPDEAAEPVSASNSGKGGSKSGAASGAPCENVVAPPPQVPRLTVRPPEKAAASTPALGGLARAAGSLCMADAHAGAAAWRALLARLDLYIWA